MKILTFQHKSILEELNNGIYRCSIISNFQKDTPECYQLLRQRLMDKTHINSNPIFGWYKVLQDSELIVNKETIKRCMEMTEFNNNDYLLFELEIPENLIDLQAFYSFVDARCEEEGFDAYYDSFEEFPFDTIFEIEDEFEIQATFPEIRKEWVTNVYKYDKEFNYEPIL